ncbi:MAG TPA: oligosaccharide flippase family protein [Candidatus Acidoferrum sp.]|nr:oligosaccharide flippase family protein [Candidatus Acidoferrum sp.]
MERSKSLKSESHELGAKTAHTASFVLIGKFSSIIFLGLSFIVVARLLGPSGYGIYTLAIAVAGFFGAVGNLGVNQALNKFIPEHIYNKDKPALENLLSNSFFVSIIAALVLTGLAFAFSGIIASYVLHSSSYTHILELASLTILASILYSASYSALLGFYKGGSIAAINTIQAALQASIGVGLVVLGLGPAGPIIGMIVGYLVAFLYSIYLIYTKNRLRILVRPTISSIKKIFSFSLPLAASSGLSTLVSNLAYIVLGAFATTVIIGNLGVASKINSLIDIVAGSISVSLLSMYSTTLASKKMRPQISRFYNHTIYYSFILLAPVLLYIAVLAMPFSYVAFSAVYAAAPLYIAIMAIGSLIGIAGGYASTLLISANKVKDVLKYNVIISVAQLVLLAALIPLFKGIGYVVLFFIITPVITNVLFIRRGAALFKLGFDFMKLYRILAANAVAIFLVIPLIFLFGNNYIPLLIMAAIALILIYPAALSLLRGIDRDDIKRIRSMMSGIPALGAVVGALLGYTSIFMR